MMYSLYVSTVRGNRREKEEGEGGYECILQCPVLSQEFDCAVMVSSG